MKSLILIITFSFIFLSCAKKDEEDTTATATSCATDTTASGSITVGSETMSGVYLSACNDGFASSAGSSIFPSDVKPGYSVVVVTGDAAISVSYTHLTLPTILLV